MNSLAVAVLFAFVACTSASGIIGGLGIASARGALEGALGGQWIPDVPVAAHGAVVAPAAAAIAAGPLGLGLGAPLGLGLGLGGLGGIGALGVHGVSAKGALEGALGGQWIPDTHGK